MSQSHVDLRSYLAVAPYPCYRDALERTALAEEAPMDVLDGIRGLPDRLYRGVEDVPAPPPSEAIPADSPEVEGNVEMPPDHRGGSTDPQLDQRH